MRVRMRFDLRHVVDGVHNANGLYRRTRTYAAWIQRACASRDHSDQRGAVSRRFPKKSFRTPLPPRSKRGVGRAFESKKLFPKIASPVASRRFGPSQESDTGALGIASSEIDATAACMYIGRIAIDAHGGACSGPSA